ncbi:hypothetical protein CH252_20955 [Rhodococcus sp. 06-1477-1B]|nr:hypothetical protein CH252_20955 [Rhodococcus sp. 06-1477-1B]
MTDEQVDRIVEALQSGEPWWMPVLLLLIGAVVGFLASQVQDWFSRRRKKSDDESLARRVAAQNAMSYIVLVTGLTPAGIHSRIDQLYEQRPAIATGIYNLRVEVATWWLSQTNKLLERESAAAEWTPDQEAERLRIAASTMRRMDEWGRGKLDNASFSKEGNEAWAAAQPS